MESSKRKKEVPAVSTEEAAKKPIKTFRLDPVSVSIFANDRQSNGEARTYYSAAVTRSYRVGNEWRRTHSFDTQDLGKLIYLLKEAGDFIDGVRYPQPEGPIED